MGDRREEAECEFLSRESLSELNYQQAILFADHWDDLIAYLRNKGKNPEKHEGYSESDIRPRARRIYQVFAYVWKDQITLQLDKEHADNFIHALNEDEIRRNDGDAYASGGKRKFEDALETYLEFRGVDWTPPISFDDEKPTLSSDPFKRREREALLNAALDYQSPPTYSNLSPDERDRWKGLIAQWEGIPKEEITREDWNRIQRSWKIPSIVAGALDLGMRAKLVGRLKRCHVDLENQEIRIPAEIAVKNDVDWTNPLTERSVAILERFIEERKARSKYDDSERLWLNRKGNPYDSGNLNDLLNSLIEKAGIQANGRKLTWHSIRHSTGMYVYDQEKDLELVAEILRQTSLDSASLYAHPTPETKRGVIEAIQGGAQSV